MNHIEIKKVLIAGRQKIACCNCRKPLAFITSEDLVTPDGSDFFCRGMKINTAMTLPRDGIDSGAFLAWDFCIGCGASQEMPTANFAVSGVERLRNYANIDLSELTVKRYFCYSTQNLDNLPKLWLMFEYHTSIGIFQSHRFGPFPEAGDHRRAIMIFDPLWSAMREMVKVDTENQKNI